MKKLLQSDAIENQIFMIRGQRVMLDCDLANLYGILTKNLNKAVTRNLDRFPEDFVLVLMTRPLKLKPIESRVSGWCKI